MDPTRRSATVGAALRVLRERSGLSGEQVAATLGWSQSKISRIETAKISISLDDLIRLLRHYGADEQTKTQLLASIAADTPIGGAWLIRDDPPGFRPGEIEAIETQARTTCQYQPLLVPGRLQDPEYATGIARLGGWPDPETIVASRRRRQRTLEAADGPRFRVALDARALLSVPGDLEMLRRQIAYITQRAQLTTTELRVVPLGTSIPAVSVTPFSIYRFEQMDTLWVVHVELQTVDIYLSAEKDIVVYRALFDRLFGAALSPEDSLAYLASLPVELTRYGLLTE